MVIVLHETVFVKYHLQKYLKLAEIKIIRISLSELNV